jgi:hypothetical protein
MWSDLLNRLAGGEKDQLRTLMVQPGRVEMANKEGLDFLLPAALLYDYPLDRAAHDLTVCPMFTDRGNTPSAETACFHGACPTYDDRKVVCPSGFWGFRHQIGYAASLTMGDAIEKREIAVTIPSGGSVAFTAGASNDPLLTECKPHLDRVRTIAGTWRFDWSRAKLLELFSTTAPAVVYLYGHGGRDEEGPFFEVGSGDDGPIIGADLEDVANWRSTRPLVFLNGCHSAALAPQYAFAYATSFLLTAHASAVVGTEIAVFENLAVTFAEDCLRRFVVDRVPLGESVQRARLALLDEGNPLGLVYIAFGPSELRLAG